MRWLVGQDSLRLLNAGGVELNKTRLEIAKNDILRHFQNLPKKILREKEIRISMSQNRDFWRLSQDTNSKALIAFLKEKGSLVQIDLRFPYRKETLFAFEEPSIYQIAMALKRDAYLSHYSAMFWHSLTEQVPKTVYVNVEQPPKRFRDKNLVQERIDLAFQRQPRLSKNVANYRQYRICLINGMKTGQLGVVETTGSKEEKVKVTNLERTLIDITVRPFYAGGVLEVLKAFRMAKDRLSVNKVVSYLTQLDYVYPYHQAIGFYLEKSGEYRPSQIELLQKFDIEFDFYLTYAMKNTSYSSKWRLFYPKGL
jgi:predicted transcriptional regulator of viral defense system